jgi:hypothetical protein
MNEEGSSGAGLPFRVPRSAFIFLQQNVGRLQVAVDDALLMGVVHGPGERLDQDRRLRSRGRLTAGGLGQAAAVDQLHREVRQAVVFADFVDLNNVGMVQTGHRFRLGLEAGADLCGRVLARQDHLERNEPIQATLPGLVHHGHAAVAQFPQDLVPRHLRPGFAVGAGDAPRTQRTGQRLQPVEKVVGRFGRLLSRLEQVLPMAPRGRIPAQGVQRVQAGGTFPQMRLQGKPFGLAHLFGQELGQLLGGQTAVHAKPFPYRPYPSADVSRRWISSWSIFCTLLRAT